MVHTSQPRKQLQSTPQQFTGWRAEDSRQSPSHPFHTSMTLSCSFLHLRDSKKLTGVVFVLLERNTKLLNAENFLTQLNLSTTATFGIEEKGHCRKVKARVKVWNVCQKKVAVVERWPLVEVWLIINHKCGCVSSKFTTMLLGDSILLQEYFKLLFVLPCFVFFAV